LKCKYCGTETRKDGRLFSKQGQLNLHEYHCKMKHLHSDDSVQEQEHEHVFRFLNLNSTIEKKAYHAGFKEVCSKCQELR
jgi:hypothetical protein